MTRGNHITSRILPEPIRLNLHKLVCVDEAMSCRPSIRNTFPSHIHSVNETVRYRRSVIRCDVHNNRCAQNKHLNYHSVVAWYTADHRRRRHWRSSSSSPLYSTNQTKKKTLRRIDGRWFWFCNSKDILFLFETTIEYTAKIN